MRYSKNILLTGAGFTKNFGGFLAEEMWAQIILYPEIQNDNEIIAFMRANFDYEKVYYEIMHGRTDLSSAPHKNAIHKAIMQAYENLDYRIRNNYPGPHEGIFQLIKFFKGSEDEIGFFFSLNQDLYIERLFNLKSRGDIALPGIDYDLYRVAIHMPINDPSYDYVRLTATPSVRLLPEKLNYIKLHGSCNWKSYDGSDAMVIGLNKKEAIEREPLLREYYQIFEEALQGCDKVLVIGYGFGDDHINEIISKTLGNNGGRLYVLSPESPKALINKHCNEEDTRKIFNCLAGYFQFSLDVMIKYPIYPESNLYFKMIKEIFGR